MSGHSKWNNIKIKKQKVDGQRAKVFTKIGQELEQCIRIGGGADPNTNAKLRECIAKAKSLNVPNENIERIIKKAMARTYDDSFEEVIYEGYAVGGAALIVEALTDNRNRTAGNLKHYFDKFGGKLGTPGCVSHMFLEQGVIIVGDTTESEIMEDAINLGADDIIADGDMFKVITDKQNYLAISKELSDKGYTIFSSELTRIPKSYVSLTGDDKIKFENLLEKIEGDSDINSVWHNCDSL